MTVTYHKLNDSTQNWEDLNPLDNNLDSNDIIRITVIEQASDLGAELRKAAENAPCESCGAFVYYPDVHVCGD